MEKEVLKAVETIKAGGVILYPTETVWGLGCDPKNDDALKRINEIKGRSDAKNFIVMVPDQRMLQRYAKEIPDVCYDLIEFATQPLTIIYPRGQYVSDLVMPDDGSIAVRLTTNEFCIELMKNLKSGIISTSANFSGGAAPTSLAQVEQKIVESVDYVVNLPVQKLSGKPSQIVKIGLSNEVEIIRK